MKRIERIIIILFLLFLTACEKEKEYVYFNYNCNTSEYYKCELKKNKLYCDVKTPTCEGKNFLGWYEAGNYDEPIDLHSFFLKNTIIYARWKGDLENPSKIIEEPSTLLEEPSEIIIDDSSSYIEEPSFAADGNYYTLTLIYNNGGSTSPVNISVQSGKLLPNLGETSPTKEGYKFKGWYDNPDYKLGTQYYNASNIAIRNYDKNENITLYAGWEANVLSITYNGNGGIWDINSNTYSTNVNGTVILKSTREIYSQQIKYGSLLPPGGLIDADGKEFNWKKEDYKVESGKEYIIEKNKNNIELNQNTQYAAKQLAEYGGCDLSKTDCTIMVKPNWKDAIILSIDKITHKSAFVTVYARSSKPIAGYYFTTSRSKPTGNEDNWVLTNSTKLEIAKLPGNYYVYVKNSSDKISEPATLNITYDDLYNDGPKSRNGNAPLLNIELPNFLSARNDSINNFNDFIAQSVKSAGLFTKEGVATAGISAPNYLLIKYGINIPYISNHYCFNQRYNENFGANPKWGHNITLNQITYQSTDSDGNIIYPRATAQSQGIGTFCEGRYGGLDCASFVGWSIHNGGFKAENTIGSYEGTNKATVTRLCGHYADAKEKRCDSFYPFNTMKQWYATLEIGDQIANNDHVMLIIGKFDNGVYVYEGTTPVGMGKYTYNQLHSMEYYIIGRMRGYYANKNNYACLLDSYNNLVSIPSAWKSKSSLFRTDCKA